MPGGQRAKPTALHLVQGTAAKLGAKDKARRAQEMRPEMGVADPPETFTADQRAVWARVVADTPPGVLARTDYDLLVAYVAQVAARDAALKLFNASGSQPVIKGARGGEYVTNPFLRSLMRLSGELRQMQGELGFTPAARVRVSVSDDHADDPLERFL